MEKLTKAEMIEFYAAHIAPASPIRAKLVVNLIAQSSNPKEGEGENGEKADGAAVPTSNGEAVVAGPPPVLIEDVRDYKARLIASAGARPITPLSEFLEIDPKL